MTEPANKIEAIRRIEQLSRQDPGHRGLATFAETSDLLAAARELLVSERVVLVTGFCVRAAMIGETDGPSGTLAVADMLRRLGKDVVLVTDQHSEALLSAGARPYGAPFPILRLSCQQSTANQEIAELLESLHPTHVIAIERPGSAVDGHRYSMRGDRLDDLVPAADRLLEPLSPRDFKTVAIGDGGNELGFGGLRDKLKNRITHGELIFCATQADLLIPAGISNWGAFALVAALSILSATPTENLSENEFSALRAIVDAGAVDGCTGVNTMSVDGLDWTAYSTVICAMQEEVSRVQARS